MDRETVTATEFNRRPSEILARAVDGALVEVVRQGRPVAWVGPLDLLEGLLARESEIEMTDDQFEALMTGVNGVRTAILELAEATDKASKRLATAADQSDSVRAATTSRATNAIEDLVASLNRRA
ncbi:type II toxin-antitoxin system Phd/YefM family antitoxin [Tsukamurella paurometabola]|nr:type II toxin-antitoxin system prevent-host-death family antitoxin [Tsukamurella paurometabola]